jgi:hypothetical protein
MNAKATLSNGTKVKENGGGTACLHLFCLSVYVCKFIYDTSLTCHIFQKIKLIFIVKLLHISQISSVKILKIMVMKHKNKLADRKRNIIKCI